MLFQTATLADPQRNGPYATLALALLVCVFAYSSRFGKIPILAFYALWLPLAVMPLRSLWRDLHRPAVILALPLLALVSVLWSDRPEVTLRAAVQYGTTVGLGLVAARTVSMTAFARGLWLGGLVVLLYSHAVGDYAYDVVDGSYAFAGAFSSKNQLGLFASLTLIGALGALMLERHPLLWLVPLLAVAGFALWTVVLTESATAMITLVLSLAVMGAVAGLMRFDSRFRIGAVTVLVVLAALATGLALQSGALDAVLGVFGKDSTLTGRTYLWSRGIEIGGIAAPWGLGYNAFWVEGRSVAEELWLEFYITTFTGFHFHNTLIEGYVALGTPGMVLLASWIIGLPALAVMVLLSGGPVTPERRGAGAIFAALAVLFALRAFVEIDIFSPYVAGSFLVPFLLLTMADRLAEARQLSGSAPHSTGNAASQHGGEPFPRHPAFHRSPGAPP